jgi:hypothetical protein
VANEYDVGDRVRLTATWQVAGALTDPATPLFRVLSPDGVNTLYNAPTHDGTGVYHQDITVDQHGTWYYRAEGAGTATGAAEGAFTVKHSRFA